MAAIHKLLNKAVTFNACLCAILIFLFSACICQAAQVNSQQLAPVWQGLAKRLAKDGIYGPEVDRLLAYLPPVPSQSPMGRKISELYQRQFFPKPKPKKLLQEYYKGVVTEANAQLCREYIKRYETAFRKAEQKYGVPPAIGSALLFVETRLGKVLADVPENAFYTLASMAVCVKPNDISQWLPKLSGYRNRLPWLEDNLRKKSDWAYMETAALIKHMIRDRINPDALPSSIYGAIGICQFMPSNITPYGADGNGDGRVDLFDPDDAIMSLANYLYKHGWRAGISRETQHKLLMSYNHSVVYANTILALGALIAHRGTDNQYRKKP